MPQSMQRTRGRTLSEQRVQQFRWQLAQVAIAGSVGWLEHPAWSSWRARVLLRSRGIGPPVLCARAWRVLSQRTSDNVPTVAQRPSRLAARPGARIGWVEPSWGSLTDAGDDAKVLGELLAATGSPAEEAPIRLPSASNHVVRVGDVVVRLPTRARSGVDHVREAANAHLAAEAGVGPRVLLARDDGALVTQL